MPHFSWAQMYYGSALDIWPQKQLRRNNGKFRQNSEILGEQCITDLVASWSDSPQTKTAKFHSTRNTARDVMVSTALYSSRAKPAKQIWYDDQTEDRHSHIEKRHDLVKHLFRSLITDLTPSATSTCEKTV